MCPPVITNTQRDTKLVACLHISRAVFTRLLTSEKDMSVVLTTLSKASLLRQFSTLPEDIPGTNAVRVHHIGSLGGRSSLPCFRSNFTDVAWHIQAASASGSPETSPIKVVFTRDK